jgi:hypothetical protein
LACKGEKFDTAMGQSAIVSGVLQRPTRQFDLKAGIAKNTELNRSNPAFTFTIRSYLAKTLSALANQLIERIDR